MVLGVIIALFVGVISLGWALTSMPTYEDHEIIVLNAGNSTLEYQLFANDDLIGQGTVAPHTSAVDILRIKGNPDLTMTLVVGGQSYVQIFGGGGIGSPPAMPDTVYFIVSDLQVDR